MPVWGQVLGWGLGGLLALWILLIVFMATQQSRMIFVPGSREIWRRPDEAGLAYEELRIPVEADESVSAWWIAGRGRGPLDGYTLLFCHGNGGTMSHLVDQAAAFHGMGFAVLLFDYRGYGESDGSPSEANVYADARAGLNWLTDEKGIAADRIVILGHSLGGAVASRTAIGSGVRGVILESTFASIPEMAAYRFPFLPAPRLISQMKFDNVAHVRQIDVPILVAHGRADATCPYSQGVEVFEAANEPKRFVELEGGHADGGVLLNPGYAAAIIEFVLQECKE